MAARPRDEALRQPRRQGGSHTSVTANCYYNELEKHKYINGIPGFFGGRAKHGFRQSRHVAVRLRP